MSRDFNGTSDNLSYTGSIITTFPFSISVWYNPDTLTGGDKELFGSHDDPSVPIAIKCVLNSGDSWKPTLYLFDGTYRAAIAPDASGTAAWQNAIFVATSNVSYTAYRNNGTGGTTTTAVTMTLANLDRYTVGKSSFDASNYTDGKIAYLAVWNNYALTAGDRTDLQTKSPLLLSTAPTLFLPLTSNSSPEPDDAGSADFTVNGATFSSDNPTLDLTNARSTLMLRGM